MRSSDAVGKNIGVRVQERELVGAQFRDGFARPLVNRPASFPGAPVKPLHGAGDERIVIVRFYRRLTNLSESQEGARKSGAVKKANPGLALFVPRDQHIEFLALSHLLLG